MKSIKAAYEEFIESTTGSDEEMDAILEEHKVTFEDLLALDPELDDIVTEIKEKGISRGRMEELKAKYPDVFEGEFSESYPINSFTIDPSPTNTEITMEALGGLLGKVVAGIGVTALLALIGKFIHWLLKKQSDMANANVAEDIDANSKIITELNPDVTSISNNHELNGFNKELNDEIKAPDNKYSEKGAEFAATVALARNSYNELIHLINNKTPAFSGVFNNIVDGVDGCITELSGIVSTVSGAMTDLEHGKTDIKLELKQNSINALRGTLGSLYQLFTGKMPVSDTHLMIDEVTIKIKELHTTPRALTISELLDFTNRVIRGPAPKVLIEGMSKLTNKNLSSRMAGLGASVNKMVQRSHRLPKEAQDTVARQLVESVQEMLREVQMYFNVVSRSNNCMLDYTKDIKKFYGKYITAILNEINSGNIQVSPGLKAYLRDVKAKRLSLDIDYGSITN